MKLLGSWINALRLQAWSPLQATVRGYEKKAYMKRRGFIDKIDTTRLASMPRLKDAPKLPMPNYNPKNVWSTKRALLGQNDYIDILGDGTIHPVKLLTNVPFWLRGFAGNEFQRILRKQKFLGEHIRTMKPTKYEKLKKQYTHAWRYLNFKTNLGR